MTGRLGPLARAAKDAGVHRRLLLLSVLLGAAAVLAAVGLLATSGYLISRAAQRPEILSLTVAIVGVRAFGIARALLRYGERLSSHELAFRTLGDLRRRFFARLVPLVPGGLGNLPRAEILSRFVADVDRLQDLYLRAIGPLAVALLAGAGAVAVAAAIWLPAAGVLAAFLLLAATVVPIVTRAAARSAGRRQGPARARLAAATVEALAGAREIAVAGREAEWIDAVDRSSSKLARIQLRDAVAGGIGAGLSTALAGGAALAVAAVMIPAVGSGSVAGVLLAAAILLTMAAFEAVAPLAAAAGSLDACATSAARVEELTERAPAVRDPGSAAELPADGDLTLSEVSFRYGPGSRWILRGADLRLRAGVAVALVGSSGAGKTTIAELLVRFLDPVAGRVAIGGVDLRETTQAEVRTRVALASQDAYLFATTIRENLAIGNPGAGDDELREALRRVGLGGWLSSLPGGLDTSVGELGGELSGGQRQRLAAARLLLSRASFLVFDEPTAHLDERAARELLTELAAIASRENRSVLVITHEPSGLEAFDEVLVLRDGLVVPAPPGRSARSGKPATACGFAQAN